MIRRSSRCWATDPSKSFLAAFVVRGGIVVVLLLGRGADAVILVVSSAVVVPPPGVVARAASPRLRAIIVRCRSRLLARDGRLGRANGSPEPPRERAELVPVVRRVAGVVACGGPCRAVSSMSVEPRALAVPRAERDCAAGAPRVCRQPALGACPRAVAVARLCRYKSNFTVLLNHCGNLQSTRRLLDCVAIYPP